MELAGDNGKGVHGLRSRGCGAGVGAAPGVSDVGAPAAVEGGGSVNGPLTPHAASGATPTAAITASPMAARRILALKSRNIGAES